MSVSFALTDRAAGLEISDALVRWSGPSDPDALAPIVAWELRGANAEEIAPFADGDPVALASIVTKLPMPANLLAALARRCVERDASACVVVARGAGFDARWSRAVAAAMLESGRTALSIADVAGDVVHAERTSELRVLPDGSIAMLDGESKHVLVLRDPVVALPLPPSQHLEPSDRLALFDGDTLPSIDIPRRAQAGRSFAGTSNRWLLSFTNERLVTSVGWVAKELVWTHVETGARAVHPWDHFVHELVEQPDAIWCTTPDGLWRFVGGEAPMRVWSGDAWGVAIADGVAWLSTVHSPALVAVDLASGAERARVPMPKFSHRLWVAAGGIVASHFFEVSFVVGEKLVGTSQRGRDVGAAILADGTAAATAGEQLGILDPDGTLRWCAPLPYDGQIRCATRDRFVFGPVTSGIDRVKPDALLAIDRDGQITARLPGAFYRSIVATADHVYAIEADRGVLRWDPRGVAPRGEVPAPPPRRPTERGVMRPGYELYNPRDDWPEHGIAISQTDALFVDGTYGGSRGVAPATALHADNAAVVTFVRCDLSRGGDGEIAGRGSTVIAIGCTLPVDLQWSIEAGCHFVAIDCTCGTNKRSIVASGPQRNVLA